MPIRAALVGVSAILFGISNSSAIAEQPAEPEQAMNGSTLENEIKLLMAGKQLLAYVLVGNEDSLR